MEREGSCPVVVLMRPGEVLEEKREGTRVREGQEMEKTRTSTKLTRSDLARVTAT